MKYALMIAGILTMCVPEDASVGRFIVQGAVGLIIFLLGVAASVLEEEHA